MTIQLNLAPNSLANLIAICEKRPNLGLDYKILSNERAFKEVEVTMEYPGKLIRWVAKRGGIHDWAIYYYWSEWDIQRILDYGDKVLNPKVICKMVPCNDEAFKMYRF